MAAVSLSSSLSSGHPPSIFRPPPPPPRSILSFPFPFQPPPPTSSASSSSAFRLRASRRPPNFPHQEGEVDPRNWNRNHMSIFDDEDEDDEEEEEDRSLDLLIRFVENVFNKISKRARKSLRSLLPNNIPTSLVAFSVNGVIILAFFSILKAFLEVVCTLGSVVFVSILLVRGVWTGISYFQQGRTNDFDDDYKAWTGTQPVA